MQLLVLLVVALPACLVRAEGYGQQPSGYQQKTVVEQKTYYAPPPPPTKKCYMCAYSPPKTYYDQKVIVETHSYGKQQNNNGYGGNNNNNNNNNNGYGQVQKGGYQKKTVVPVPYTVNGGWDKCLGPFDHYQAQAFGVDVWDCHSNCYVRRDKNGDIFRGCYKGEFGVNPYSVGCTTQAGSTWCFCEGSKCNNGVAPPQFYH